MADAGALGGRLEFDLERGEVRDGEVRYLLIRPDALMGIFRGLAEPARGEALAAFARSVRERGARSARRYQALGADDAGKLLATIEATAPQLGWGRWRFLEHGPSAVRLEVANSPFAAGFGESPGPVCAAVVGMLETVARLAFGGQWQVVEDHCSAQGRARCRFSARAIRTGEPAVSSSPEQPDMAGPEMNASHPVLPRPEQTFFADPALDRAFGVVMALATEVYVLRDRLAALEAQLAARGALDRAALAAEPPPEERAARAADRDAFVAHLMHNLLGEQQSKGAP